MTDKIHYDHKFGGLLIELSDEELQKLARQECEKHNETELLENRINHITYQLPEKKPDTKHKKILSIGYISIIVFWIIFLGLIILGVIKFTETLANWIY